jgi:hypothetical protein
MSPVEAIRGLLRSSTAVDPEPTAQTDPKRALASVDRDDGPCPFPAI